MPPLGHLNLGQKIRKGAAPDPEPLRSCRGFKLEERHPLPWFFLVVRGMLSPLSRCPTTPSLVTNVVLVIIVPLRREHLSLQEEMRRLILCLSHPPSRHQESSEILILSAYTILTSSILLFHLDKVQHHLDSYRSRVVFFQ